MAWFLGERRGPQWKHGWMDQTLSSLSLPPFPLLAIFGIIILFMSLSQYSDYKAQLHQTRINSQFFLLLCPLILVVVMWAVWSTGRFTSRLPNPESDSIHRAGGSPWGVGLLVLLLLFMLYFQSSFQSQWFRPLWRSY